MRRADNGLQYQSLLELVPIEQSVFLVETRLNMLDWIHCVVHVPTYVREHKAWIERLRRGDREVKEEHLAVCASLSFDSAGVDGCRGKWCSRC